MLSDIGDVSAIQRDGDPPTVVTAGSAPGESGIALVQLRYQVPFFADIPPASCLATAGPAPGDRGAAAQLAGGRRWTRKG